LDIALLFALDLGIIIDEMPKNLYFAAFGYPFLDLCIMPFIAALFALHFRRVIHFMLDV